MLTTYVKGTLESRIAHLPRLQQFCDLVVEYLGIKLACHDVLYMNV